MLCQTDEENRWVIMSQRGTTEWASNFVNVTWHKKWLYKGRARALVVILSNVLLGGGVSLCVCVGKHITSN